VDPTLVSVTPTNFKSFTTTQLTRNCGEITGPQFPVCPTGPAPLKYPLPLVDSCDYDFCDKESDKCVSLPEASCSVNVDCQYCESGYCTSVFDVCLSITELVGVPKIQQCVNRGSNGEIDTADFTYAYTFLDKNEDTYSFESINSNGYRPGSPIDPTGDEYTARTIFESKTVGTSVWVFIDSSCIQGLSTTRRRRAADSVSYETVLSSTSAVWRAVVKGSTATGAALQSQLLEVSSSIGQQRSPTTIITTTAENKSSSSGGSNGGAIAGAIIGVLIGLAVVAGIVCHVSKKRDYRESQVHVDFEAPPAYNEVMQQA